MMNSVESYDNLKYLNLKFETSYPNKNIDKYWLTIKDLWHWIWTKSIKRFGFFTILKNAFLVIGLKFYTKID